MKNKELEYLCGLLLKTGDNLWLSPMLGEYFTNSLKLGIDEAEKLLYNQIRQKLKELDIER